MSKDYIKLSELNWLPTTYFTIKAGGYNFISDFEGKTVTELKGIPNITYDMMTELLTSLRHYGYDIQDNKVVNIKNYKDNELKIFELSCVIQPNKIDTLCITIQVIASNLEKAIDIAKNKTKCISCKLIKEMKITDGLIL